MTGFSSHAAMKQTKNAIKQDQEKDDKHYMLCLYSILKFSLVVQYYQLLIYVMRHYGDESKRSELVFSHSSVIFVSFIRQLLSKIPPKYVYVD